MAHQCGVAAVFAFFDGDGDRLWTISALDAHQVAVGKGRFSAGGGSLEDLCSVLGGVACRSLPPREEEIQHRQRLVVVVGGGGGGGTIGSGAGKGAAIDALVAYYDVSKGGEESDIDLGADLL